MTNESKRIPPLPIEDWSDEVREVFEMAVPPGLDVKGSDFNSILMFANNPPLAKAWLTFNAALSKGFGLPVRLREIAILRIAWRYRAAYEWTHHLIFANLQGLGTEHFCALQGDAHDPIWTPLEMLVIRVTDEFDTQTEIGQTNWDALIQQLSYSEIMELFFLIGSYQMIARVFNTTKVAVEPAYLNIAKASGWPLIADQ